MEDSSHKSRRPIVTCIPTCSVATTVRLAARKTVTANIAVPGNRPVADDGTPGYTRYGWTKEDRMYFDSLPKYLRDEQTLDFIMQDTMDMATAKTLDGIDSPLDLLQLRPPPA